MIQPLQRVDRRINGSRRSLPSRINRKSVTATAKASAAARHGLSAIVIGSGVCGLSAANVLSHWFDQVVVIERDEEPLHQVLKSETLGEDLIAYRSKRRGVSQVGQPHVMLGRGAQELERQFPGFQAELMQLGAVDIRLPKDMISHRSGLADRFYRGPGQACNIISATRALIEAVLRQRVASQTAITIHTRTTVKELVLKKSESGQDANTVAGVVLQDGSHLEADLVVDASGRNSRLADWLVDKGYERPPELIVDAGMKYVSAYFEHDQDVTRKQGWVALHALCAPNIAVAIPIELGVMQVLLAHYGSEPLPTSAEGMLEAVQKYQIPYLKDFLPKLKPLPSKVLPYGGCRNHKRQFDQVALPEGLLVMGDALCFFNPVFGQGMTVAAMQASVLDQQLAAILADKTLSSADAGRRVARECRHILREFTHVTDLPWQLATLMDTKLSKGPDSLSFTDKLLDNYLILVQQAAANSFDAYQTVIEVEQMMQPPTALFKPQVLVAVVRHQIASWLGWNESQKAGAGQEVANV